jgi:hypothetical protein
VVVVLAFAVGIAAERRAAVGYQTAGTPIYTPESKINRDTAEIGKFVPTNIGWIVLDTPEYPSPQSGVGTDTLRMTDDLANYLMSRGDVVAVLDFSGLAEKPMNMLLHNGQPKYYAVPDSDALSASLWGFFFAASAPERRKAIFDRSVDEEFCIRLLLPDHTYRRLTRLRADLDSFIRERSCGRSDSRTHLRFISAGEAGDYIWRRTM